MSRVKSKHPNEDEKAASPGNGLARKVAKRIKAIGFTGCVAIHPSHVAVANELFRPNKGEIEFSAGVLNAMRAGEAEGIHAVRYRGMMIDAANLAIAQRTLEEARNYGMPIPELVPAVQR